MKPWTAPLVVWTLAAGCAEPPCADAACRASAAHAAWARGEAEGLRALDALPPGIERDALGLALVQAAPERAAAVCPRLGPAMQRRCEQAGARPHLAVRPAAAAEEADFRAAEALVQAQGAAGYAAGLARCAEAPAFQGQCHDHLLTLLAEAAPAAHAPAEAWEPLREAAQAVDGAWRMREPARAAVVVDQLWSMGVWRAVQLAGVLSGDALDHLPADAAPHLRAAVVTRMMRRMGSAPMGLEVWEERAGRALSERRPDAAPGPPPPRFEPVEDLWRAPPPGEALPTVSWLGTSRRLRGGDARADLRICVLEAGARYAGPQVADWLSVAAEDADPAVRATAARLERATGGASTP